MIGAQVRRHPCYLIWLKHWIRSRADRYFQRKAYFRNVCATCSELQSNISTRVKTLLSSRRKHVFKYIQFDVSLRGQKRGLGKVI